MHYTLTGWTQIREAAPVESRHSNWMEPLVLEAAVAVAAAGHSTLEDNGTTASAMQTQGHEERVLFHGAPNLPAITVVDVDGAVANEPECGPVNAHAVACDRLRAIHSASSRLSHAALPSFTANADTHVQTHR